MARRRIRSETPSSLEADNPVYLWLLRMVVPLGAYRTLLSRHSFQNEDVGIALGLAHWLDSDDWERDCDAIRRELRQLHQAAERRASRVRFPEILQRNLDRLGKLVNLTEVDRQILAFCAYIKSDRLLDDTADWLGLLTTNKVIHVLSVVLGQPESAIRDSLSPWGPLGRTGLVSVDRNGSGPLNSKLDLLNDSLADHLLCTDDPTFATLLRDVARKVPPPSLSLGDFDHIGDSLAILQPYLTRALATRRSGVNVFIYGTPGTGKSQLARVLAREVGCELQEVSNQDSRGDAIDGERRLRAYRFAQRFFSQEQTLMLFDEAEDVFNDGNSFLGRKSTAQLRKAWVNASLEENPVPTLWLSNSVRCLDPAFARRFDLIIELPVPPRSHRERLIRDNCGDWLPAATVSRIAESENLAPAVIARAASVVTSIADLLPAEQVPRAIEQLVANTLVAQGHEGLAKAGAEPLSAHYDPQFTHADADLAAIAAGVARHRSARLCLYGPPGTGKSAYGHWLAWQLNVPVHQRRASDLMSKYVGGTERNLAAAFRQAEQEGALLLLDEVDSFLQDRRGAHRSWEITEVNEMLTQMESYGGVLIATTNLVDDLDQAALRRFDLKLKFDYLTEDQAWQLLCRHCQGLGLPEPEPSLRRPLAALDCLTPGDFAVVLRQQRFRPANQAREIVQALEAECQLKDVGRKAQIGFI